MSKKQRLPQNVPPPLTRLPGIYVNGASLTLNEAGSLALKKHQRGQFQAAVDIYDVMLGKFPNHAGTHYNRALALQNMEKFEEAAKSYSRTLELQPHYPQVYNNRSVMLLELRSYAAALADCDRAVAQEPNSAMVHTNRGNVLNLLRRYDEAVAAYRQAIALKPEEAFGYLNLGIVLLSKGNMPEAEAAMRKSLELKPEYTDPWVPLTRMRKYKENDIEDLQKIESLLERPGFSRRDRENLHFALGKIQDDRGNYDAAFACYQQANENRNASAAYDPAETRQRTDRTMAVFDREYLDRPHPFSSESQVPLFVVGMPRSGTTLITTILSKHRLIATAGELSTLGDFARKLAGADGCAYPEIVRNLSPQAAATMVEEYEKRLRRDANADLQYVIDKHPLNFGHLGLINLLFPKARIIHCTRDPLDTGLSTYFQQFSKYYSYASSLQNIGHFYLEYARLMEHWKKLPSIHMMEVSYDDMIVKTEEIARKVLDWLGLDWDESCLAPQDNSSPVETFSQWQVRQPIYTRSIGRWKHYDRHLGPLKEVLDQGK